MGRILSLEDDPFGLNRWLSLHFFLNYAVDVVVASLGAVEVGTLEVPGNGAVSVAALIKSADVGDLAESISAFATPITGTLRKIAATHG
jgi:hypothetical protein